MQRVSNRNMGFKRIESGLIIAVIALVSLLTCATPPPDAAPPRDAAPHTLVLLHTNDHHGAILPNNGKGGLAERAAFVKSVRADYGDVLLVDAGDINTGPALSNMFDAKPDFTAYNLMGYDAATFGNHEFDKPLSVLREQLALAAFPFVSSNIKEGNTFLGGNQYLIKQYDGYTVGIFAVTTLRTKIVASPDKSLVFIPEIEAAQDAVAVLKKEKVDIIIGLTHIGDVREAPDHVTSPALAQAVPDIDIIIDGHSHSLFEEPLKVGGTWIVTANEWGKQVGKGVITIAAGEITGFDWKPVAIDGTLGLDPDAEVAAMLEPYITKANESLKEVVGEASETFVFGNRLTRYGETALGNMVTDANVWYFEKIYNQKLDFAFHNGGGIRAELPRGPVTQERVLTVLPFENYLFIASLKGSDILALFDFIATVPQGAGGFPQFSKEVRYTLDLSGGEGKITGLTIGGAPVDPNKTYRFCTNDYMIKGGDGYEALTKSEDPFNTSLLLSYVVGEYVKAQGTITPATDGRMTVVGGVTP
ncbi:MAG: 5'-nucleotidase C-terminal domain-containing protein [Spirochaetaceae bacterium]|nr:5'-nucleotidase C-terminal domain-containing protein [Spirochaetaceae bacterium]